MNTVAVLQKSHVISWKHKLNICEYNTFHVFWPSFMECELKALIYCIYSVCDCIFMFILIWVGVSVGLGDLQHACRSHLIKRMCHNEKNFEYSALFLENRTKTWPWLWTKHNSYSVTLHALQLHICLFILFHFRAHVRKFKVKVPVIYLYF